jgi:hypothetical protein
MAVLLALALGVAPAAAQGAGRPLRDGPVDPLTAGAAQRLFDLLLLDEAEKTLTLTAQQYPEFVVRLRALQDARRTNLQQRTRLLAELQRMTGPRAAPADEGLLKERLAALRELESRTAAELRRAYSDLDEVLLPWQQARFRVLEEQLERRKLDLLTRARQNRQQQRRQ